MANFKSVIAFGKKCKTELERLDIVILNAGMTTGSYKATEDGWEVSDTRLKRNLKSKKPQSPLSSTRA